MTKIKPIHLSKMNWFLVLTTAGDIFGLAEFKDSIPTSWMVYVLLAQGVIGVIIRNFFTAQPTTQFAARRV